MSRRITFTDAGGFRIVKKSSTLFDVSFSVDFDLKYYPSTQVNPTFPSTDTGWSRIILFAIGGGSNNNNHGIVIFLEKYNNSEYITAIYNKNNNWNNYLPNLNNGNNIQGITVQNNTVYHITFNYMKDVGNGTEGCYELNVIDTSLVNPTTETRSYKGTTIYDIRYQQQTGIGCTNENIGDSQTTFPNLDYDPGLGTIYAYSARNLSIAYVRVWCGNVVNSSTTYNASTLCTLNSNNTIIDVKSNNYAIPTSPYPRNFGTSTDPYSPNFQRLAFQINATNVTDLQELVNTAYYDNNNKKDGTPATLTNSPTGYAPLEDFGVNPGPIILEQDANSIGDPHIFPLQGKNYDIYRVGLYLYFEYCKGHNYTRVYSKLKRRNKKYSSVFNDIITIAEKCGNKRYVTHFDFKNFQITNMLGNMSITKDRTLYNNKKESKNATRTFNVFCLNENIKIKCNEALQNVSIQINTKLINQCNGALVSQEKLVKY